VSSRSVREIHRELVGLHVGQQLTGQQLLRFLVQLVQPGEDALTTLTGGFLPVRPIVPRGIEAHAERVDEDGAMERVFLSNASGGRPRVILAQAGRSVVDEKTGRRRVELQDGWAYEGVPGNADYRVAHFERYSVWLDHKPVVVPPETIQGLSTTALLATPGIDAVAEWHWRLAKPVHVFILVLFAVVLAHTDARRGRLANLFAAILIYFIYSNLLGLGQTLLKKGQVPSALGLWWIHGLMLVLALYLFYRRANNRPLLPPLRTVWGR